MAERHLSSASIEAGREFLAKLDEHGLRPETAGWVFAHGLGDWRYVVASAAVDSVGRRKLYGGIIDILDTCDFGDALTDVDIHLASPSERWYRVLQILGRGEGTLYFIQTNVNGWIVDALLYRMFMPVVDEANLTLRSSKFVKKARKTYQKHMA